MSNFPNFSSGVDGTHIKIKNPGGQIGVKFSKDREYAFKGNWLTPIINPITRAERNNNHSHEVTVNSI